jgi:hypothetical protein
MFFYLSNDTENQLFYTIGTEDVNKYRYFDTNNAHAPPSPFLNVCTGGGGGGGGGHALPHQSDVPDHLGRRGVPALAGSALAILLVCHPLSAHKAEAAA